MFHGKPSHLDVPVDSLSVGSCQVWRVTCSWEDVRFPSACASESRGSPPTRCLQTAESAYTCIPGETLRPPTPKTPQPPVPFQWPGGLPGQVLNLNFDPNGWTTCAFRARIIVLSKILIGISTLARSVDTTQFQLFHPSLEDMTKAEKLFYSSPSHKIDYYTSAERMDHVPALKAPEVCGTLLSIQTILICLKLYIIVPRQHQVKQGLSR